MFVKRPSAPQLAAAEKALHEAFGEAELVCDIPVKEYMIKWLSVFAPDMSVYDAKSFCLPKLLYKNYLWHAFSFQKTDCDMEEDAKEALERGFYGPCFVLLNGENILARIPDGKALTAEKLEAFSNIVVFTEDFGETYVNTGSPEFGPYYKAAEKAAPSAEEEPEE